MFVARARFVNQLSVGTSVPGVPKHFLIFFVPEHALFDADGEIDRAHFASSWENC